LLRMLGQLASGIGVLGVIWHLSSAAGWVLLIVFVSIQVFQGTLAAVSLHPAPSHEPPPDYEI
ncbi:MAG: hypothetical protein KGO05_02230, partial [Chloroflexota bacterium]|nr:hypothetical protein [Chloroflexota bacterium]